MNIPFPDLAPVVPEITLTVAATVLLLLELVAENKRPLGYLGIVIAAVTIYLVPLYPGDTFGGMFVSDTYSIYFKYIFLISLILTILISLRYLQTEHADFGEYYSLLLFATAGM
ncbi:MAG TPA: hypothetical protein VMB78_10990, partial [Dissulfurispiraceae bacterium]|nr:hypothetical protein [Dissulfurispiraceae bacterium]